jgi:type IV secretory pathway VirJ component
MSDFFSKLKVNAAKTATAAKKGSGEAIERLRINKDILAAKGEHNKILSALAKRYYDQWKADKVDFDEIDAICQKALDKEELVEKLKEDLKKVGAEPALPAPLPAPKSVEEQVSSEGEAARSETAAASELPDTDETSQDLT